MAFVAPGCATQNWLNCDLSVLGQVNKFMCRSTSAMERPSFNWVCRLKKGSIPMPKSVSPHGNNLRYIGISTTLLILPFLDKTHFERRIWHRDSGSRSAAIAAMFLASASASDLPYIGPFPAGRICEIEEKS